MNRRLLLSNGQFRVAFSRYSSFDSVAVANTEMYRQRTENCREVTSSTVYGEVPYSYKYLTNYFVTEHFIDYVCELFAQVKVTYMNITLDMQGYKLLPVRSKKSFLHLLTFTYLLDAAQSFLRS